MKVYNRVDADHYKVDVKQRHRTTVLTEESLTSWCGKNSCAWSFVFVFVIRKFSVQHDFFFLRWTTSFERKIKSSIYPVHHKKATRP